MKVHSIFILKESGICIYRRIYTKQFKNLNLDLITPFFSAIFTFSKLVMSKELEILEMGELRFVFRKERGFIFVILADENENLLFLESRLKKIAKYFFKNFKLSDLEQDVIIDNDLFDGTVDPIVYGEDDIFFSDDFEKKQKKNQLIQYFRDLSSKNEISGAALLSMEGNLLYSSVSDIVLFRTMKEIEMRYMLGEMDLPEQFCTMKNGIKVCERIIEFSNKELNLLLIIEFHKNTTLGMAEWIADEMSKKLEEFFN
ncbi:MAG: hypothetical protein ACTSR8_01040 [Promethearchaeota archaeon]